MRLYDAMAELESRLIVTWCERRDLRRIWTPDPDEMISRRSIALAKACQRVAASNQERLGSLVISELAAAGELEQWGHESPLAHDAYYDPVRELRRASELRGLVRLQEGLRRVGASITEDSDLSSVRAAVSEALRESETASGAPRYSAGELLRMAREIGTATSPSGAWSGLTRIDRATGGLRPGHCWAVGAPTNWGKSGLLIAMMDRWQRAHGGRALMVSCEDAPELISGRLAARWAQVAGMLIRDGRLAGESLRKVDDAMRDAETRGTAPVLIDGRGRDVEHLAGDIREAIRSHDVGLVLVDYLQCIASARKHQDRRNEVNFVGRCLTDAIKSSGAAGILASQITDDNLRESRDLEHAAEVVLIGRRSDAGQLSLYVKKNKTGPKGFEQELVWDGEIGTFVLSGERSRSRPDDDDYEDIFADGL